MNKIKTEDIIKILPKLNKADLKKIQSRLDYLTLSSQKESDKDIEVFYKVVTSNLYLKLKDPHLPFYLYKSKRRQAFKKLCEVNEYVTKLLANNLNREPSKVELQKWYNIFSDVMIKDFDNSPIPLNLDTLLNNCKNFPGLIDKSYPDYIRCGMIEILLGV